MSRSYRLAVLLGSLAVSGGCSFSSSSSSGDSSCLGPACDVASAGKPSYDLNVGAAAAGAAGIAEPGQTSEMAEFCGLAESACVPDVPDSCEAIGAGAPRSSDTSAGAAGQGGADDGSAAPAACRVQLLAGVTRSNCDDSAGEGQTGDPCLLPRDCASGLTCVEEDGVAECRPYCCSDPEICPTNTYCDLRPTSTGPATTGYERLRVPVCVAAQACRFDDPYPCPPDTTCSCPTGLACAVVRPDGTTACVTPGTGGDGEPCPCAPGHVCSAASETCLKVCRIGGQDGECGMGQCQSSSSLPEEWGVCVGTAELTL